MSAIAIEQGDVQLQVEAKDGTLQLYVQGSPQSLPTGDNVYMITANGVSSILNNGLDIQSVASQDLLIEQGSSDQLSLQVDDSGTLVIITPGGATVMVSLQMSFLQTTVILSDNYVEDTRGLMGVYNGDPSDDFTLPNGTVLSGSLTEAEVYTFGLQCKYGRSSKSLIILKLTCTQSTTQDYNYTFLCLSIYGNYCVPWVLRSVVNSKQPFSYIYHYCAVSNL